MQDLSRPDRIMVCIVENIEEMYFWQNALEPYVIQTIPVKRVYEVVSKIGEGSYGHVYKANINK